MRCLLTICLAGACGLALSADQPGDPAPASGPAPDRLLGEPSLTLTRDSLLTGGGLLDASAIPITLPTIVDQEPVPRRVVLVREGTTVFDRRTTLRRDADDRWWVVADLKAGQLRLLPCELLETAEQITARSPETEFRLSGETYQYGRHYYLMLRRVLKILPGDGPPAEAAAPQPAAPVAAATQPASAPAVAATQPATQPAASADDVAAALLGQPMGRPVIAPSTPATPVKVEPSVAPAGKPLPAGPGKMVIQRLGRLAPEAGRWRLLTFEADNTLREPPVQILPNEHLQWMESQSRASPRRDVIYHISGELHDYRGQQFLLVRNAMKRPDLDRF